MRALVLPDEVEVAAIEFLDRLPMNDDEYFCFCVQNPDLRIEREADGKIIIMPPAGLETGYRNSNIAMQLGTWAERDTRGRAFDSNTEYFLPDGAAFAPAASWILNDRIARLDKDEKKRFPHLCPDFVVELRSPSDRLPKLQAKMQQWIDNGAQLGWLIDADRRTIHVYRPGRDPEELVGLDYIIGEGPVEGFRLELQAIWQGL